MGCARILTASMAVLTFLLFAAPLAPQVFWSSQPASLETVGHKIGLWRECSITTSNITGEVEEDCQHFDAPDLKDKGDVHKELRDGAIAGCVFCVLLSILSTVFMCCRAKKATVFAMFLTAIFATAVVGSWVEFMQHLGDSWEDVNVKTAVKTADTGLILASCGFVTAYLGFFSSFCVSSDNSYSQLA